MKTVEGGIFLIDVLDVHTHTIASGHAYNTMNEMIAAAKNKNLKLFGIADHAPAMPGSCHSFHFLNLKTVRRDAYGIELVLGVELNILDYNGSTDLPGHILETLDFAVASLHNPCIKPGTLEQNTAAMIGAIKNPCVVIIGHPDNPSYPVDFDRVAQAAAEHNVLLEINNHSYESTGGRAGSRDKAKLMLAACKKYRTHVIMGSDAHVDTDVGNHRSSIAVLEENDFPSELVVNADPQQFRTFLRSR